MYKIDGSRGLDLHLHVDQHMYSPYFIFRLMVVPWLARSTYR